jgi:RNA polymerase sigma-70 factor (ECF subfamily)
MTINKLSNPEQWIEDHGDYLYGFAMFRLHDQHAAEDAVQETLLAALRARDSFRGQGSERTWLVGILKHKIMDHFRFAGRWELLEFEDKASRADHDPFRSTGEFAGHWTSHDAPSEWHASAEALMENKEFWVILRQGLAELPPRTATAFMLREVDGFSTEEICDALGISRENLWVMLHRARLSLRSFLQTRWFVAPPVSSRTVDSDMSRRMSVPMPPPVSFASHQRLTV